jgi:hypothetical protein
MKFLAFEENDGAFHWAIVPERDTRLVQPGSFASYEGAKQAAGIVRRGSVPAPFEDRADDTPPLELATSPQPATVRHDLNAERWLDDHGNSNSEVVTPWPSRR